MKKVITICTILFIIIITSSFTIDEIIQQNNQKVFDINNIVTETKKFNTKEIELCGDGSVKTYMEYKLITSPRSKQFQFIQDEMNVDISGFLYDNDGFIGAALGSYFGEIGSRFYFTLDNGVVLPIVKIESKADIHTDETNCFNPNDRSIIEFVIDTELASEYFGRSENGLILSGNFGNYLAYKGYVIKVEEVIDDKINNKITYNTNNNIQKDINIFYYGSGF